MKNIAWFLKCLKLSALYTYIHRVQNKCKVTFHWPYWFVGQMLTCARNALKKVSYSCLKTTIPNGVKSTKCVRSRKTIVIPEKQFIWMRQIIIDWNIDRKKYSLLCYSLSNISLPPPPLNNNVFPPCYPIENLFKFFLWRLTSSLEMSS